MMLCPLKFISDHAIYWNYVVWLGEKYPTVKSFMSNTLLAKVRAIFRAGMGSVSVILCLSYSHKGGVTSYPTHTLLLSVLN